MSTHWDDIYRNFKEGGDAWATLAEPVHPFFVEFIDRTVFPKKHALDIGSGTGMYLKFLRDKGFTVDGLDNSPTALEMTKAQVPDATLYEADMYEWEIPHNRFDLILSVSTIQHGMKDTIAAAIGRMHDALLPGGWIFITVPDFTHTMEKHGFKNHDELAPGVMAPKDGPEKGLAHSFYTQPELRDLFANFDDLTLKQDEFFRWTVYGKKKS